ncbi:MAG: 50S ribosomal protein L11 [Holosporales bacterium]|jgi:large subunit ribosomal protein L11|nr:50S ribosomal protein L11 [Holosporales bacterium]
MAKKKKILGFIKLQIPAGKANPSPPIGPALAQKALNIMEFCKTFNAKTQGMEQGMPVPVVITAYTDKTFTFVMKTPPVSYFIKKAANIQSGSGKTGITASIGKITMAQIRDIAEKKIQDMNAGSIEAACQMIVGSARSMGVDVVEG